MSGTSEADPCAETHRLNDSKVCEVHIKSHSHMKQCLTESMAGQQ